MGPSTVPFHSNLIPPSTIAAKLEHIRFDTVKGYGFIVPDDESGDVFVHQTSINVEGFRSLAENERVEFRVEEDGKGKKKAMDVTGPDGADVKGAPYNPNSDFEDW